MKGCFLRVIIGNRGVFPGSLAEEGRREVVESRKYPKSLIVKENKQC